MRFLRPIDGLPLCVVVAWVLTHALSAAAEERVWPTRWQVLFPTRPTATTLRPLPDYAIQGPYEDSPLFLSRFAADSAWDVRDRKLQVPNGANAALKLGRAEDFVLEGMLDLSGTGGMFIVFGEDDGHGYGLCSTTMISSGSPWKLFEFRGHAAVEGTDEELAKYQPMRPEPFQLTVEKKTVSLRIGKIAVFEEASVPNYHEGDVILGVFDTKYGPRKIKIESLRARSIRSTGAE